MTKNNMDGRSGIGWNGHSGQSNPFDCRRMSFSAGDQGRNRLLIVQARLCQAKANPKVEANAPTP